MKTILEYRIEGDIFWLEGLSKKHPQLKDQIVGVIAKINDIKPTLRVGLTLQRQIEEIKIQNELCVIGKALQGLQDPQNHKIAQIMADIMAPIF